MAQSTNDLKIVEDTTHCIQIQTMFGIIRIVQPDESEGHIVTLNWDVEDGDIYFFRKRGQIIDIGIDANTAEFD